MELGVISSSRRRRRINIIIKIIIIKIKTKKISTKTPPTITTTSDITMFMSFLTVFQILLYRYSSNNDNDMVKNILQLVHLLQIVI